MMCCLVAGSAGEVATLATVARACSPRVMAQGDRAVLFDATGLSRVLGAPVDIAREVTRMASEQGVAVQVALAGTMSAAWVLAHATPGMTIVAAGREADDLASLPLAALRVCDHRFTSEARRPSPSGRPGRTRARSRHYRLAPGPLSAEAPVETDAVLTTCVRWGLRSLGDLARLPQADVRTRLGAAGVRLQQLARGEDDAPLVPDADPTRFVERLELDWPIDGLEPLSFVLARLTETLAGRLERADRGAVTLITRLHLVTRALHVRTLHLPAPMRDARVVRTLILLDLESHPAPAGIDVVELEVDVTPGRIVQGSLLTRAVPSPEDLATLLARLRALVGESRVGTPTLADTHDPRTLGPMTGIGKGEERRGKGHVASEAPPAVRRFRRPVAARVMVERGAPVRVRPSGRDLSAGRVVRAAGPWRTSGQWWTLDGSGWDRDEWDVELEDGACYRMARDRTTGQWNVEGEVD